MTFGLFYRPKHSDTPGSYLGPVTADGEDAALEYVKERWGKPREGWEYFLEPPLVDLPEDWLERMTRRPTHNLPIDADEAMRAA